MRAVILRLHDEGRRNFDEFLRQVGHPPKPAEELATGLWWLPLPDCQSWLDAVRTKLGQTLGIVAMMREVDYASPWQPLL